MTAVTFQRRDTGYRKFRESLKAPEVTTGVHSAEGSEVEEGSDLTVSEIAAIHEFGAGHVPERSWLRDFVEENHGKLGDMLEKTAVQIYKGADPDVAMKRFGLAVVGMIKERIISGIEPPLDEETKLEKQRVTGGEAKDTPLIRFGQFVGAIAHEVTVPK